MKSKQLTRQSTNRTTRQPYNQAGKQSTRRTTKRPHQQTTAQPNNITAKQSSKHNKSAQDTTQTISKQSAKHIHTTHPDIITITITIAMHISYYEHNHHHPHTHGTPPPTALTPQPTTTVINRSKRNRTHSSKDPTSHLAPLLVDAKGKGGGNAHGAGYHGGRGGCSTYRFVYRATRARLLFFLVLCMKSPKDSPSSCMFSVSVMPGKYAKHPPILFSDPPYFWHSFLVPLSPMLPPNMLQPAHHCTLPQDPSSSSHDTSAHPLTQLFDPTHLNTSSFLLFSR